MTQPILAEILGPDVLIVLALIALLFGGARLPQLARSLGSAKSEFEKGLRDGSPSPTSPDQEPITLTRAELAALIAERERQAREGAPRPRPDG